MKTIREWFDANALKGHAAMISTGTLLCALDVFMFQRMPNLTVAALVTAVLIIPPFSLPAWGYDKGEQKQKYIITFAISILFGCVFGLIFGQMTGKQLEEDFLSLSGVAIFAVGVSVSLSFWTVGHMSREFIRSFSDYLAPLPTHLGRVIAALYFVSKEENGLMKYAPEQVLARNIILAIMRLDKEEAKKLVDQDARQALLADERRLTAEHVKVLEFTMTSALQELEERIPLAS